MSVRAKRPIRRVQTHKQLRTDTPTPFDHYDDAVHQVAREELVPQIRERTKIAISVDRQELYFYQKKETGRRCSCYDVETQPEGVCQICYGTGIVAGYDKYGTRAEMIDITLQNTMAINLEPTYALQIRPVLWQLSAGAKRGELIAEIPLTANKGLDVWQLISSVKYKINSITAFVKTATETVWVAATNESISQRLSEQKLQIKIVLERTHVEHPSPQLSHFYLRYKLLENAIIYGDFPREVKSITLAEYGILDGIQTLTGALDSTIPRVGTEDFIVRIKDQSRWKVIEEQANSPVGLLTSHDIVFRLIMQNERRYTLIP